MRSLAIGATGMQAQQLNVEVISNNIANSSTTGYKLKFLRDLCVTISPMAWAVIWPSIRP